MESQGPHGFAVGFDAVLGHCASPLDRQRCGSNCNTAALTKLRGPKCVHFYFHFLIKTINSEVLGSTIMAAFPNGCALKILAAEYPYLDLIRRLRKMVFAKVVLSAGECVETGTHNELLEKGSAHNSA